jgi:hypothetical protein
VERTHDAISMRAARMQGYRARSAEAEFRHGSAENFAGNVTNSDNALSAVP